MHAAFIRRNSLRSLTPYKSIAMSPITLVVYLRLAFEPQCFAGNTSKYILDRGSGAGHPLYQAERGTSGAGFLRSLFEAAGRVLSATASIVRSEGTDEVGADTGGCFGVKGALQMTGSPQSCKLCGVWGNPPSCPRGGTRTKTHAAQSHKKNRRHLIGRLFYHGKRWAAQA